MAKNSTLHAIILWQVVSMKLNICKKTTVLKIMTFYHENTYSVSKLIKLMFKGKLDCLQECFRKQIGREGV